MLQMPLNQHVEELRKLSYQIAPSSFPNIDAEEEVELLPLKSRQIVVDGYDVYLVFNVSDFGSYVVESLQIQGVYTPFLPFYLVCKIGEAFLGKEGIAYTDFVKNNRKIYCWSVRRKGNKVVRPKNEQEKYENFAYTILKPGHLNLYGQ